jgi:hypothetical protein
VEWSEVHLELWPDRQNEIYLYDQRIFFFFFFFFFLLLLLLLLLLLSSSSSSSSFSLLIISNILASGSSDLTKELTTVIHPDYLPKMYGGNLDYSPPARSTYDEILAQVKAIPKVSLF